MKIEKKELNFQNFNKLIKFNNVLSQTYTELANLINDYFKTKNQNQINLNRTYIDPRNEERIIFCPSRKKRFKKIRAKIKEPEKNNCEICKGKTTPIIFKEQLSDNSFSFINENLYPVLLPNISQEFEEVVLKSIEQQSIETSGQHFIQWISTNHNIDFHNIKKEDAVIVLKTLSEFEMFLLHSQESKLPLSQNIYSDKHYGYVSIIKNTGRRAGSTVSHPHIQIIHSNIIPRSIENDTRFLLNNKISFIEYIDKITSDELVLIDNEFIKAVIPYFMKRPYHTIIYPVNTKLTNLHELNYNELKSLANILSSVLNSLHKIFKNKKIDFSYNLLFHIGPVGTLYIEIIPFVQTFGGYEQLGLYICEELPEVCRQELKKEMMIL